MKYKFSDISLCLLGLLTVIGVLFYSQLSTHFNILYGNRFDAVIEASILEHWYNVFFNGSTWKEVGYFYPYKDTLGYNDGYFIYGVIYSFYRLFGLDIFLSSELVNLTLKIIGYVSFYVLCRKKLKLPGFCSVAGAVIFSFANNLALQSAHAQLLSICFAPLLTIFLLNYFFYFFKEKEILRANIYGCLAALLMSFWLLTTFYMAWFFIFFSTITFCVYLFFSNNIFNGGNLVKVIKKWQVWIAPVIFFIISVIPFLDVYLPKVKETGGQGLDAALFWTPGIGNIIDPASSNYVFGKLSDIIITYLFPGMERNGEFSIGFPPVILIVMIAIFLSLFSKGVDGGLKKLYKILAVSFIISILSMIRIGDFSFWIYVWKLFPGAKGMRVVARYALFLIFPLALACTIFLSEKYKSRNKLLVIIVLIFMILEQVNFPNSTQLNREVQNKFLESLSNPPKSCQAFFVTGQRLDDYTNKDDPALDIYPHNVDAMLISEYFKIRTINGFSTFNPKDWDFNMKPISNYTLRVGQYLNFHNIQNGICQLDLPTKQWFTFTSNKPFGLIRLNPNDLKFSLEKNINFNPEDATWNIHILLKNDSDLSVGEKSLNPLNIGVRTLNENGTIADREYKRIAMPTIVKGGSAIIDFKVKRTDIPSGLIDVLPVQEGVAWLDAIGMKPFVIRLSDNQRAVIK